MPDRSSIGMDLDAWLENARGDARRLADLLRPQADLFSSSELGAVLAHQMAAPLHFHWPRLDEQLCHEMASLPAAERATLGTFGDLLRHARPPSGLLLLLKDFAKGLIKHDDAPIPQALARVLYFTALAAAQAQQLDAFTQQDAAGIRKGIAWALEQPWVGEPCRGVLDRGLRALHPAP